MQLDGDLGFPESDLRDRLRLGVGDRFDFYGWQQDRDELERFYAVRGFLESRVRSLRAESDDGTVTLTYQIVRGPRSVLTLEGHSPPGDVIRQMRDAWNRAVFDGFLIEELRLLARAHLSREGFLRATIEVEVSDAGDDELKEIVLRIDEGARTSARRVAFRGNERLTTERLQAFIRNLRLDETAWADPELLARSLLVLYRSEGMLDARVTVEPPEFDADTATLPVVVDEGTQFTISRIAVEGVEARPVEPIRGLIGLQQGDVYSGRSVAGARARLDQNYQEAGFNQAEISARSTVDPARGVVDVVLEIDEGPRQVVEAVEIVGGERTHDALISRALQISPGQPVDLGAWNRARRRLYDTGAFRSVDIDAEAIATDPTDGKTADHPVRARVRLEERAPYRLRYGLQLKDEEVPFGDQSEQNVNLGVVGDLTRQNFAGRAVTRGTAFRWDTDRRAVRGFGRVPRFFGLPISSNLFVARERRTFGDPDFLTVEDLTLVTLEQRLRPRPTLTIAYSYNFDWNHSFDPDPSPDDLFGGFDATVRIARLAGGVIVDTRDNVFDASRGWFHSSNIEYAPDGLGSEFRFAKYTGQQFHYWSVGPGIVLASAARIGFAAAFSQDLILSERFFAGGGNTVRGYRQDTLGPLFLGSPDSGNALVVLNQEVRFPIFGFVRGVGFIDAGNVFPLLEDFTFRDLKVGVGLGLRLATPFGLFRLDVAAPVSEIEDDRKSRFFFSIGQVF